MDNHHTFHYFNLKSELRELYLSMSLRTFAKMMINVFIPLYLMQLGYSLKIALTFYAVMAITHAILSFPAGKIASKIGLKHSIMLSLPFLIPFYLLLYYLNNLPIIGWTVLWIAVIYGISSALFWVGHHSDFAESTHKKKTAQELEIIKILVSLASAVGPVIGSILLTKFSFGLVFLIVAALLVLSVVPLFLTKDHHEPFEFSFKEFKGLFTKEAYTGHIGFGIEAAMHNVIWPVFIFMFILDSEFIALGFITSASLIFSLIMTYIISKKVDEHTNLMNDIGSIINSILWIVKFFVITPFQVFIADSLVGTTRTAQNISFNKICYEKAKETKTLEYVVYREFLINMSMGISVLLIGFTGLFHLMFIIAPLGSLMFLFYRA